MSGVASVPSLRERIEGGFLGLLIGDALGVPYEFHLPEAIPSAEAIEFVPPAGFSRAHPGVAPGTWSDDGAQALCLLASRDILQWTQMHHRWLRALQWDDQQAQIVFEHYLCVLEQLNERMAPQRARAKS